MAVLTALAGTLTTVLTASPAAAAGCYEGAVSFPTQNLTVGSIRYLPSASSYYTTSSRCSDIQIDLTNNGDVYWDVRLCWWGGTCKPYQLVRANAGYVILATQVLDGTKFTIQIYNSFDWDYPVGGKVAA
ncbi:hypothetical protein GCM10009679_37980 [Saccharothrix algeriensis]|uniref:Streptomyces killer toxin-like beta/gamma crystallin domain-containing protein n=2 Tax=Catellatospora bangladeshensis TaxID=310355 RepID=A0A8J3JP34_9ACTN|nr:hypothetical protein Cba03nite_37440 [Catellatospora bangladeshensis]